MSAAADVLRVKALEAAILDHERALALLTNRILELFERVEALETGTPQLKQMMKIAHATPG